MRSRRWMVAVAVVLAAGLACGEGPTRPRTGSATILVQLIPPVPDSAEPVRSTADAQPGTPTHDASPRDSDGVEQLLADAAASPALTEFAAMVDNMTVMVRGPTNKDVSLTKNANGHWIGKAEGLIPGSYTVTVEGRTGTEVTYSGTGSATAGAGTNTTVPITNFACIAFSCISFSRSTVSVSSASIASGSTSTVTLQPKDGTGTNARVPNLTVVFTRTGGSSTWTTTTPAYNATPGTYTATWTGVTAGTAVTVGATINGSPVTSTLPTHTVTSGPASKLVFTTPPSSALLSTAIAPAVQVTAQDAAGNTATSFTGNIAIAIGANPGGGTLSGTATVAAVNGVATFSNLSIDKIANGYTLTASSGTLTGATSAQFDITGTATKLVFTVQPTDAAALAAIAPAIQVTAQDASGNTITSFTGDVTIALGNNPGGAGTLFILTGTSTVAAVNGVATFSFLAVNKVAAGYTLTASTTGLTGATSAPFAITPGQAHDLEFTVQPSTVQLGSAITPAVKVRALDQGQNTATGFTGNVNIALGANPPTATLSGTATVAAVAGLATFSNLSLDKTGVGYTLTASANGVTGATSTAFDVTQAVATITISPAGATITGGTQAFTAVARDANNNVVNGKTFSWISLNPNVATINNSTGVATAVASGQVTVSATVDGITGYAVLTAAITAPPVNLWAPMSGITSNMFGVWAPSANDVFAVGTPDALLRFNGTSWSPMSHPTFQGLFGIWGTSASDVYAVGMPSVSNNVIHFDGTSWTLAATIPSGLVPREMWGSSSRDVYAVTGSSVFRFDGTTWTEALNASGAQLNDIWGSGTNDVFVVGNGGTIRRFDGTSWTQMTSNTSQALNGVWGVGSGNVVAVGAAGTILRSNGVSWNPESNPTAEGLNAVWGGTTSDMYAVGLLGRILRYDGSSWTAMTSGVTSILSGIYGAPGGDVFVTGAGRILRGVRGATIALTPTNPTLNAVGSTQQMTPTARDAANTIVGGLTNSSYTWVSRTPAVATVNNSGLVTAVANGTARIVATAPGGAADSVTVTVAQAAAAIVVSPAGATITGGTQSFSATATDALGNPIAGKTFTWSSLNSFVASINPSTGVATAGVNAGQVTVAASADGVTAYALLTVAAPATLPVTLWASVSSGTTQDLTKIWGAAGNDIFAVGGTDGSSGAILHFDGTWSPMTTPTISEILYGVWGSGSTDVFAVGNPTPPVLHYNGTNWTSQTTPIPGGATVSATWGSAPNDVFAAGAVGRIAHYDGTQWQLMTSNTSNALNTLYGFSRSDVFAAGSGGAVVHYNGSAWSSAATGFPGTESGASLWGTSASDLFLATGSGKVFHYNGSTWSEQTTPAGASLSAIWGNAGTEVYAAGSSGRLIAYDGTWTSVTSGTTTNLRGLWGVRNGDLYAVGNGGLILRGYRGATLTLSPANPTLAAFNATVQLTAAANQGPNPVTGLTNSSYTWISRTPSVATVNTTGLVTAVSNGSARIVAVGPGGAADSTTVMVAQSASSITVSPAGASIAGAATQAFTAVARDANGNLISGQTFTWSTLNTSVATINGSSGLATAVGSGQSIVAATAGSATGYAVLTVAVSGTAPNLWGRDAFPFGSFVMRSIWGRGPTDIFLVGGSGQIFRFNGTAWTQMTSNTNASLASVWGVSSSRVFVGGDATSGFNHFDGATWTTQPQSGTAVRGFWGSAPNDVWAVAAAGNVHHFDGAVWTGPIATSTTANLTAIWGSSKSDIWAVGASGTLIHYDGTSWSTVSLGTTQFLADIWGASSTEIYIVGGSGTILRYNGSSWTPMASGTTDFLSAVVGTSGTDLYVAASSSGDTKVRRWNGSLWTEFQSVVLPSNLIDGIWTTTSGDVYSVDEIGTIFRGYRSASVAMTPTNPTLTAFGSTLQLTATARNSQNNVITTMSNSEFTWVSRSPGVATVNASGLVTAQSNGTARIVAIATGGAADSITVTVNQQLHHFVVTNLTGGPIPTQTAGTSFSIKVTAQDSLNATVTSFTGAGNTVTITSTSAISSGGGTTVTFTNGVLASHAITLTTAGSNTITATRTSGGSQNGSSNSFTLNAGQFTALAFTVQPSNQKMGATITPAVQVALQDVFGNTTATTTPISIAIGSNPGGGTLSGTTTVNAVNGIATFSTLSINNAGTGYSLFASTSIGGVTDAISTAFNIIGFTSVHAGSYHACGLTTGGSAYCWGDGVNGELGNNAMGFSFVPAAVSGGLAFAMVSAGTSHSCGVTTGGAAYCWGKNDYGQLGNNSIAQSIVPVAVSGGLTFAAVTVGGYHTCGVTTGGAAYCWGLNVFGQLGNNSTSGPSTCSFNSTTVGCAKTPVAVAGSLTFTALSSGFTHTCGRTTAGAAYCWGANGDGQLGNNSTNQSSIPVPVSGSLTFGTVSSGSIHTCGVTTGNAAYCWGSNAFGRLGNNSTTSSSIPVAVSGGLVFMSVSGGFLHSCGVTTGNAAYCWGANNNGQLGNNSTTESHIPVAVSGGLTFATASAGDPYTCGRTIGGAAYCWGDNTEGTLGNGTNTQSLVPARVSDP